MLHLISNIVGGFIPKKSLRDKVRTMIRYPKTFEYVRFVRDWARNNATKCKIKTVVGYGCKNFIVILNQEHVFKFPLLNNGAKIAEREGRIIRAFNKISPIKIPKMETLKYKNITVRKYEFARGTLLTDISPKIIAGHRVHIAKQIANMLYVVGRADPVAIRDLKQNPKDKPGYLYGWFQGDIWQNFMLDENFNITYFIDWEDTQFQSFMTALHVASHNWDKFGYRYLIVDIMAEYSKLYFESK